MSNTAPTHRVKELIDACPMNTMEAKKELARFSGLGLRTIQLYYSGDITNIKSDVAIKFLAFFNSKREEYLRKLQISDIIVDEATLSKNAIASNLGLVQKNDNLK